MVERRLKEFKFVTPGSRAFFSGDDYERRRLQPDDAPARAKADAAHPTATHCRNQELHDANRSAAKPHQIADKKIGSRKK